MEFSEHETRKWKFYDRMAVIFSASENSLSNKLTAEDLESLFSPMGSHKDMTLKILMEKN